MNMDALQAHCASEIKRLMVLLEDKNISFQKRTELTLRLQLKRANLFSRMKGPLQ